MEGRRPPKRYGPFTEADVEELYDEFTEYLRQNPEGKR